MKQNHPYRIAIRTEGEWVRAYFAAPDTMEGAQEIATIRRSLLNGSNGPVYIAWRNTLRIAFDQLSLALFGGVPATWREDPAPEHERMGEA